MIVTSDEELAKRLRLLRSHGMTTLTWDRHRGHASGYDVVLAGFNYRIDEVRATVGLFQLSRLVEENEARARIAGRYRQALDGVEGLTMPFRDHYENRLSSHHLAVVLLPDGIDRDRVRAALAELRIQTSVHYPPVHTFALHRGGPADLPVTATYGARTVTLPLYAHMTTEQVDHVAAAVLEAA